MTEDFKREVRERWEKGRRRPEQSRIWAGLFIVIIGAILLARTMGVIFPWWFFTWPMILVAVGLFSGFRHGFRGIGWLIVTAVGLVFLADETSLNFILKPYIWPIIIISVGLMIIFRPNRCRRQRHWMYAGEQPKESGAVQEDVFTNAEQADRTDRIDITAILSGVKKIVLSKNFKGGDITAFMGGAELDLRQADFQGRVLIDSFNMFGGTKIIVPADWDVQSDIVAIFGGVDDKRPPSAHPDSKKVLVLDGTCLFGGVEIRSF
jgi:predicted membrane protein